MQNKPDFATVATTGDYSDLINTPTAISDFTMDANSDNITNLADPVSDQDAATKAYVDLFENRIVALELEAGMLVEDIDGNIYETVKIGNQIWMAENLKVTHYPNGDTIPLVTYNTDWGDLAGDNTSDAYSYYNNDTSGEALYTYAAAIADNWTRDLTTNQGICPDGWHLPSDDEWKELEMALGMSQTEADDDGYRGTNEGSKLAGSADLWDDGALVNDGAFGTSGFTGLPGGFRVSSSGDFSSVGAFGRWWTATEDSSVTYYAWYRDLGYNSSSALRFNTSKGNGFSVRCLRD